MKKVKILMLACSMLVFGLAGCNFDSDSPDSNNSPAPVQNGDKGGSTLPVNPEQPVYQDPVEIDTELLAAYDNLAILVDRAQILADKAEEGDETGDYEAGALAPLTAEIKVAKELLDADDADKEALKLERLALVTALNDFFAKKNLPSWSVIFERSELPDQSRVKIIWEKDEDALNLSCVSNFDSFVIDDVPAHIYWPDNANQLIKDEKTIVWAPAFTPEAFEKGSHVLTFQIVCANNSDTEKYDFTFAYDLENEAAEKTEIKPLYMDIHYYKPTVADVLPKLESVLAEAKEMLNKAEEGEGYGEYETGSKAVLDAAIAQAELAKNAEKASQVEDAVKTLKEAVENFAAKKNIPGWKFQFKRLEGTDQTEIDIIWEDDQDALTEDAIKKENASFVLDGKVSNGFWAADGKTSGVEDKTLFYKPLFNEFYNPGPHTFEFTVIQPPKDGEKHQKEWKVTLKYNPAVTVAQNTAFNLTNVDVSYVKHDWAAEAKVLLKAALDSAEEFAEKAAATGDEDNIYYETSDIDTFRTAISAANGVKENSFATEDEVEAAIKALSEAKESLKAAKKIRMWNVEFLRRTDDQTTVTIYWQNDEYKLENAENSVVDEEGKPSVKSFRIDEVVAGQYWPGTSMGNTKNENFITLVPTFAAPALNNGSHTLYFTLVKAEDEYEIEVPFTLSGESNTDECAAEIADVIVKKVDPAVKAAKLLKKAKEAFQTLIEKTKQLAASLNPAAYEEGAVDSYKAAISAAENEGKTAESIEEVKAAEKALSDAEKTLFSKKLIESGDVKLLRRTKDQTTVTIYWQKDEYKLEDARNAVIDENGAHSSAAFRVDDTVSHTYYPDGAADFITESNYIALKPAFHEPALHNGSHTLYFTLVKGEDEYEIEVPFTLSGKSDTDECEAEIGQVKVSKVDPAVKAKDAFKTLIEKAKTFVASLNPDAYEEGAVDNYKAAISEAENAVKTAESIEEVKAAEKALSDAEKTLFSKKLIEKWEVEIRHHDGDQYEVVVSWAKDDFAIDLDSVSNGNATFVTDGKPSHTYWPADKNKVESNRVIFNPANDQLKDNDALGEHTLVFDLKPLGSDKVYDITVSYSLDSVNSWATILSTIVKERSEEN